MGEPDSKGRSSLLSWQGYSASEKPWTLFMTVPSTPYIFISCVKEFSYSSVLGTCKWLAIVADPKLQFSAKPKETHLCWRNIWKHICFRSTFWGTDEDKRRRPVALRLAGLQEWYPRWAHWAPWFLINSGAWRYALLNSSSCPLAFFMFGPPQALLRTYWKVIFF